MFDLRRWLRPAAVCTALFVAAAPSVAPAAPHDPPPPGASREAREVLQWIQRSGDAQDLPFAVVDKRAARLYVFDAQGRLAGQSPALLGSAPGDHIAPEVGLHAQQGVVPAAERTTPAGRFEAAPGLNAAGEHVVWVDYASAFAIHRLRPGLAYQPRAQRLATAKAGDKRVSWGCVVVPVAFYEHVVQKVLGHSRSMVYVLPETRPVRALLQSLDAR